jgi:glycosyltransferase involved in cell wall biosynthesis
MVMRVSNFHVTIFSAYPPNRGRLSEYAFQLVNALTLLGVNVTVLSDAGSNKYGNKYGEDDCKAVKIVECWKPDYPLSFLHVFHQIIKQRSSVVLFNLHFAVFGRTRMVNFLGFLMVGVIALLGRLLHFKTVLILHNLPETIKIESFGLKKSFLNRLGLFLAEILAFKCDSIVVTTRLNKKLVEYRFHRQASYIPHGAWIFVNDEDGAKISKRDSLVFLGYLSPNKNLSILSQIYQNLRLKHPWLKLKLITSPHPNFPDSIKQLKELLDIEGVEYLGYRKEEELPSILRSCVALILPYTTCTGTSGVLHLVSHLGLPVVAPDLPEFRECLYDGAGIILCRDEKEMERAIDHLIINKDLWLEMSLRSRSFAEKRSWQNIALELLKVIEKLK